MPPVFSPFGIIKKNTTCFFTIWVIFCNISRIYFFFLSVQNIKSNCYIIFLKFFLITFFWWKTYSLLVIFTYKRFNFCTLCVSFLNPSWLNATVTANWKHLSFLLIEFIAFLFLSNQENLYMIHHHSHLFYNICNTINGHNQRRNHHLSLILRIQFDIFNKWFKKFFNNLICFIIIHYFYVIAFWMHYTLFIIIFRKNKNNCYC